MQWLMTFRIALRALARNKIRASDDARHHHRRRRGDRHGRIGEGAKSTNRRRSPARQRRVFVSVGSNVELGGRGSFGNVRRLAAATEGDARANCHRLPRRQSCAGRTARRRESELVAPLQGVAPEFQRFATGKSRRAAIFTDGDMESAASVAVIGQTVARQLFGNDDPLDGVIRIRNIPFRIVGTLVPKVRPAKEPIKTTPL